MIIQFGTILSEDQVDIIYHLKKNLGMSKHQVVQLLVQVGIESLLMVNRPGYRDEFYEGLEKDKESEKMADLITHWASKTEKRV